MDAGEFLVYKKFNGFLYYVDVECQFLDKYLYNRVVGSQYPENTEQFVKSRTYHNCGAKDTFSFWYENCCTM